MNKMQIFSTNLIFQKGLFLKSKWKENILHFNPSVKNIVICEKYKRGNLYRTIVPARELHLNKRGR